MHGNGSGASANVRSIFVVVEEIDDVLFDVSALVIVLDDHSDVLVPGHTLDLAIGEAKIKRPLGAVARRLDLRCSR
jgi:hypothetical protein